MHTKLFTANNTYVGEIKAYVEINKSARNGK